MLFCLLLCGCGRSTQLDSKAGTLPPFPVDRRSSVTSSSCPGDATVGRSANAIENVGFIELPPPAAGGIEWATYQLTASLPLRKLFVEFGPATDTNAWLAVANFSTQHWELSGPYNSSTELDLDAAQHVSPNGSVFVGVIVTAGGHALIYNLGVRMRTMPVADMVASPRRDMPGTATTLDASASVSEDGSIVKYEWDRDGDGTFELNTGALSTVQTQLPVAPGGRRDVAVRVTDDLGYTATATTPIASVSGVVLARKAEGLGGLRIVDGTPAVVYFDLTSWPGKLAYRRAEDAYGNSWAGAVTVDTSVQRGFGAGVYPAWDMVDGRPAVVYTKRLTTSSGEQDCVMYCHALDAQGSTWGAPQLVHHSAEFARDERTWQNTFMVVNGNPAVVFTDLNYKLYYMRASDPDGDSWPAPTEIIDYVYFPADSRLFLLDGKPAALAYLGGIQLVRALDANGDNWQPAEPLFSLAALPAAATLDGLPAMAISSGPAAPGSVHFSISHALDAQGQSWSAPLDLTGPFDLSVGGGLKVIAGYPWAWCCSDSTLSFARAYDAAGTNWPAFEEIPDNLDVDYNYYVDADVVGIPGGAAIAYNYPEYPGLLCYQPLTP